MRLFGFEFKRATKALSQVSTARGWWPLINEPSTGAWQKNAEQKVETKLQYPTLYACISRIATDIGKLPYQIKRRDINNIWKTIDGGATGALLRRPNHYQTEQQFRESWILSKLIQGNTYALKERDARGGVVSLLVLDPWRVLPLISESGEVFYQLYTDNLNLLPEAEGQLIVPASEIIHDRCIAPFHPLIGLPPLAAANLPTLKNLRILRSSAEFFGNNAQPSGILSAPGPIADATADRLKTYWNDNFTGSNAGKVAVVGDGLSFVSLAAKSVDAQMVEQLRYSDEQICQPFGIPPFKVGIGAIPAGMKIDDINQLYYSDALQTHIESMEALLDQGLDVTRPNSVELDLWPLLRMDPAKQAAYHVSLVSGSIEAINEARNTFNLPKLDGGDTVYMQMQDMPLDQVRQNTIVRVSEETVEPAPAAEPDDEEIEDQALMLALLIEKELTSYEHA